MTYNELSKVKTTGESTNWMIAEVTRASYGYRTHEVAPGFLQAIATKMVVEQVEFVGSPFTKAYQTYCEVR